MKNPEPLKIYPRGEDGYKTFSIRVKRSTTDRIDKISSKTTRTRNELIGTLLEYALDNLEIVENKDY